MKKKLLIFSISVCAIFMVNAQQVVSSGGFSEKQGISVDWVLGGRLSGLNTFVVNEQPGYKKTQFTDTNPEFSFKLYPTITRDFTTLEITTTNEIELILELFNSSGMKISESIIRYQSSVRIYLTDLTSGMYFIKMYVPQQKQEIFYSKIIKL